MTTVLERDVGPTRISCVDTAKLVRAALKSKFPGTKFSVRSSSYSGGASIDVSWRDGPTGSAVDEVIRPFGGADFDGMVDLKISSTSWLLPDGSVTIARFGGQGSTWAERIESAPSPDARLVRFGADYVFGHREVSDVHVAAARVEVERFLGRTFGDNERIPVRVHKDFETGERTLSHDSHDGTWGSSAVRELADSRDYS